MNFSTYFSKKLRFPSDDIGWSFKNYEVKL